MNIASTKTAPSDSTSAKTADVTVVGGAGHVGIPLVLAFAKAGLMVNLWRAYEISTMTVGLLGMAFKAEVDDTRASLSYKLKHALEICAGKVLTTDPFVATDPNILPFEQVIARGDILILCTPHSVYAEADLKGKPVVDVWGFLKNANVVY